MSVRTHEARRLLVAREKLQRGADSLPPQTTHPAPSLSDGGGADKASRVFKADNLMWDGMRLRLRTSERVLAVLRRDVEYPTLWRAHVGCDHITDLVNLTRAKDAAMCLAIAMLNGEVAIKQSRKLKAA